jgi:hypothetical protein
MSNHISEYKDLSTIEGGCFGLNIEGCRPIDNLPCNCVWWNIVQVIDNPFKGITFDWVLNKAKENKFGLLESAVNIDIFELISRYNYIIVKALQQYDSNNILVHIHQYKRTTILNNILSECHPGVKVITDETNYYENPVNYKLEYPNIQLLISLSQCAGLGSINPGEFIIPSKYIEYDIHTNKIINKRIVTNEIKKILPADFVYHECAILVVNDLWNPII